MQLDRLRHRRLSTVLAQWLSVMFLLQIMLPVQAHSRLATDRHGITVVMCTLQGESLITVDLATDPQLHSSLPSSAMLFSEILADTTSLVKIPGISDVLLGNEQIVPVSVPEWSSVSKINACSRAPPHV